MTKATTEGRQLVLEVEGIDAPFRVDPLPAKRGKILTEQFVAMAVGQLPLNRSEDVFVESFGPANYSRMAGVYLDEFDPTTGEHRGTWTPAGFQIGPRVNAGEPNGSRYVAREALPGEPEIDGEPIRQEEAEALCLCAFYWQTVVGIEAVQAFIDEGEGSRGSLKAMGLLRTRLVLSTSANSSSPAMETEIQRQANSAATSDTPSSFGSARLPAHKRSIRQNMTPSSRRR